MGSSSAGPRSVVDPDAEAYDAAMRKQRATNAEREEQLRKAAETAEIGEDVHTGAEFGAEGLAALSGDIHDMGAVRALKKLGGPLGPALSLGSAMASYHADRLGGMPADEAFIKHGGGFVLGQTLGAAGSAAGATGAALATRNPALTAGGGTAGAYMGQWDGEDIAKLAAKGWAGAKHAGSDFTRTLIQGVTTLDDPRYWANRWNRQ